MTVIDGDDLHSLSNKNKMRNGIALDDKDRMPWLLAIRRRMDEHEAATMDGVHHVLLIACSSLKFVYREMLRGRRRRMEALPMSPNKVSFVMLDGSRNTLEQRSRDRSHEFMARSLLQSNLDSLEYPNREYIESDVILPSFEPSLDEIIESLLDKMVLMKHEKWRKQQRISCILGEYKLWRHRNEKNDFFSEILRMHTLNECIDDFVDCFGDDRIKENVRKYLFDGDAEIMSDYDGDDLYVLSLQCMLSLFLNLSKKIKIRNIIKLDHRLVANIMTERFADVLPMDGLDDDEVLAMKLVMELDQEWILRSWEKSGVHDREKHQFLHQIRRLDHEYPGGLTAYHSNAMRLFEGQCRSMNGWKMSKPDMVDLSDFGSPAFSEYERLGLREFGRCGFVLLGGGFGERLGLKGNTLETGLPSEITTMSSYMEWYIATLLAFQDRARSANPQKNGNLLIPLAITTSGRGHLLTQRLLDCWFLQDTNAVAVRGLPAAMGVSAEKDFAMNTIGTPRRCGDAYGAICKLMADSKESMTINVEYNELIEEDNKLKMSPFPANTNTLIIRSDTYCEVLGETKGMMPEFVNPKYADSSNDKFKSPARLECMMQEYPKLLFQQKHFAEICGDSLMPKWIALQPTKKNIFDSIEDARNTKDKRAEFAASNGEASVYFANRMLLKQCGLKLEPETIKKFKHGINVKYGARICLHPSFGVTLKEIKHRFVAPNSVRITTESTLVLRGNIVIKSLELDGALIVKAHGDTQIVIERLVVNNKGWHFQEIEDLHDESIDHIFRMRGYTLKKEEARVIEFDDGQKHVIAE